MAAVSAQAGACLAGAAHAGAGAAPLPEKDLP